jgi:tetratricopeptide (TPR) repeat protein
VARVLSADEPKTVQCLSEVLAKQHFLVAAVSSQRTGDQTLSLYRFRHHLFQQYAYQQLDAVSRAHLHRATGHALEKLYGQQAATYASELAHHFEAGNRAGKAADHYLTAGKQAYRLSANEQALAFFRQGLRLLETTHPGADRDRRELALQLALCAPLRAMQGFGSAEVEEASRRAVELAQNTGDKDRLFAARLALVSCVCVREGYRRSLLLGQKLLRQAEEENNALHLAQAHHIHGLFSLCSGEFIAARDHFEFSLASHDPGIRSALIDPILGQDLRAIALTWLAFTSWCLGYPDQAMTHNRAALARVQRLDRLQSLAFITALAGCQFRMLRREYQRIDEPARELADLSRQAGMGLHRAWADFYLGRGAIERGQPVEGLARMSRGAEGMRALGQKFHTTMYLAWLAEAHGTEDQGQRCIEEALQLVAETDECFFEAELHRLQGELLARRGDEEAAGACFQRALDISRRQQARSWELRAGMSLARLRQQQGRPAEGHDLLAKIYGWFTEGFDTPDLQQARTLLAALRRQPVGVS